jgi:hypothetical protein
MKTIPPKLPHPRKGPEGFPPINFTVLHGRVIESFEAKIPVVHGGGATVRTAVPGSAPPFTVSFPAGSWIIRSVSNTKIDFGRDYVDMRFGHDATMLWANEQLFAIANHTTGKIRYPALHWAILPEKKVGSFFGNLFFNATVFPMMLVASWYGLILFLVLFERIAVR